VLVEPIVQLQLVDQNISMRLNSQPHDSDAVNVLCRKVGSIWISVSRCPKNSAAWPWSHHIGM